MLRRAAIEENTMNDLMLGAWKAQLETGMRALESITEAAIRLHAAQLQAATEAHADLEATRKAIAAATDASQLTQLCAAWARANAGKSFGYWRSLAQAATPQAGAGPLKLEMIDGAYQQWLETVQRFYKPFEKAGS
jgi:hypothetical protein